MFDKPDEAMHQEAIASLKLLACLAKADEKQNSEEKKILTQAFQRVKKMVTLPESVTLETILAADIPVEEVLPNIVTRKTQILVLKAAYAIAEIDDISTIERTILDKIEASFKLPENSLEDDNFLAEDIQSPNDLIEAVTAQLVSAKEIRNLIFDYALGVSILGFNPIPGFNLVTSTIAGGLIVKMVQDMGKKYGYPKGQDAIAIIGSIFGGFGALTAAIATRLTVSFLGLFVPVIGEFAAASFLFALTWAAGQAANQFYLSGRQLNAAALREAFLQAQKEGKILSKKIDFKNNQ